MLDCEFTKSLIHFQKRAILGFWDFADPQFTDQITYLNFFFRFCTTLQRLTSAKNFIVIHPLVWGAVLHPPFTCKPVSKHSPVTESLTEPGLNKVQAFFCISGVVLHNDLLYSSRSQRRETVEFQIVTCQLINTKNIESQQINNHEVKVRKIP